MAEKPKLKAAVAGWRWGAVHMQGFLESEHADLLAMWTQHDTPEARAVAKRFGVKFFTDFERMLEEIKPDLVSVAVPERAHAELTLKALEHGCHVYCEKVLSDSLASAQKMVAAARDAALVLNVGYNYRYSPSFQYLAGVVKSGQLGEILFGLLRAFTFCIHHMTDYANSLLGRPERVIARIDAEPRPDKPHKSPPEMIFPTFNYSALTRKVYMVEYEDGPVLMAGSTDYSSFEESAATLLLEGTDGRAALDDLSGSVTVWSGSREVKRFVPSQILDRIGLQQNGIAAVKDFARAVAEGEDAPIPGQVGVEMIKLEEAVKRSAASGQWETV